MPGRFLLKSTYNVPFRGTALIGTVLSGTITLTMKSKIQGVEIIVKRVSLGLQTGIHSDEDFLREVVKGDKAALLVSLKSEVPPLKKTSFWAGLFKSKESLFLKPCAGQELIFS